MDPVIKATLELREAPEGHHTLFLINGEYPEINLNALAVCHLDSNSANRVIHQAIKENIGPITDLLIDLSKEKHEELPSSIQEGPLNIIKSSLE